MAETKQTVIVLTAGDPVIAQIDLESFRRLVSDSPKGEVSHIRVVDQWDTDHWINVHEIVQYYERTEPMSEAFS